MELYVGDLGSRGFLGALVGSILGGGSKCGPVYLGKRAASRGQNHFSRSCKNHFSSALKWITRVLLVSVGLLSYHCLLGSLRVLVGFFVYCLYMSLDNHGIHVSRRLTCHFG